LILLAADFERFLIEWILTATKFLRLGRRPYLDIKQMKLTAEQRHALTVIDDAGPARTPAAPRLRSLRAMSRMAFAASADDVRGFSWYLAETGPLHRRVAQHRWCLQVTRRPARQARPDPHKSFDVGNLKRGRCPRRSAPPPGRRTTGRLGTIHGYPTPKLTQMR
jgi:hypothetical protein